MPGPVDTKRLNIGSYRLNQMRQAKRVAELSGPYSFDFKNAKNTAKSRVATELMRNQDDRELAAASFMPKSLFQQNSTRKCRWNTYLRLMEEGEINPFPVDFEKLVVFCGVLLAAGYTTANDYMNEVISVARGFSDQSKYIALEPCEQAFLSKGVARAKRAGLLNHMPANPIFLSAIESQFGLSKDKPLTRGAAAALTAFYFGLRVSEWVEFDTQRLTIVGEGTDKVFFSFYFQGLIQKGLGPVSTFVRCICRQFPEAANVCFCRVYHFLKGYAHVGGRRTSFPFIDIPDRDKVLDLAGGKSHGYRIGSLHHVFMLNLREVMLLRHFRWQSVGMILYYSRTLTPLTCKYGHINFIYADR